MLCGKTQGLIVADDIVDVTQIWISGLCKLEDM